MIPEPRGLVLSVYNQHDRHWCDLIFEWGVVADMASTMASAATGGNVCENVRCEIENDGMGADIEIVDNVVNWHRYGDRVGMIIGANNEQHTSIAGYGVDLLFEGAEKHMFVAEVARAAVMNAEGRYRWTEEDTRAVEREVRGLMTLEAL